MRKRRIALMQQIFRVVIDYGLTLQGMIVRGKYNWVSESITPANFPVEGSGKLLREVTLIHFNRAMSTQEALEEMDWINYRPATIEELLALGASQKELPRQFRIIALGSGKDAVPYLDWDGNGAILALSWVGHIWSASCRFLAVRQ